MGAGDSGIELLRDAHDSLQRGNARCIRALTNLYGHVDESDHDGDAADEVAEVSERVQHGRERTRAGLSGAGQEMLDRDEENLILSSFPLRAAAIP